MAQIVTDVNVKRILNNNNQTFILHKRIPASDSGDSELLSQKIQKHLSGSNYKVHPNSRWNSEQISPVVLLLFLVHFQP